MKIECFHRQCGTRIETFKVIHSEQFISDYNIVKNKISQENISKFNGNRNVYEVFFNCPKCKKEIELSSGDAGIDPKSFYESLLDCVNDTKRLYYNEIIVMEIK